MNLLLAGVQVISILTICIYEYRKKWVSVFLWGTLLVMFGLPHFIGILFNTTSYDPEVMIKASLFAILFNTLYLLTKGCLVLIERGFSAPDARSNRRGKPHYWTLASQYERDRRFTSISFGTLAICLIVLLTVSVVHFGGVRNTSWGKFYGLSREMGLRNPLKYTNVLFFASAGVALAYRESGNAVMFLASSSIIVAYAMITGNRITILPLLVTLITSVAFSRRKRIALGRVFALGLMGICAIYVVYLLRLLRIDGGIANFMANFSIVETNRRILHQVLTGDGELGLREVFYYFIYHDNDFCNFNKAHTYIRLLLIAVPTRWAGGLKPPDFAISMGSAWSGNPANTTYSVHPTLYGDCFANLWWLGILLGMLWALLSYVIDRRIDRKTGAPRYMLMVLLGTVYVIVGRGSVYNGMFLAFTASIMIAIIGLVMRFRMTCSTKGVRSKLE